MHLANRAAEYLKAQPNPGFDPHRRAITGNGTADDFEIICRCEKITRGQILEAIGRGAKSVEAVKRRLGTGMGRCQGSRCGWRIAKILKETGVDPEPLF
jgi:glycerol-3-phosphate dehydrogenase